MTWFKVDDQLHDHKKFRKLGDDRLAACGLWTHCGSWAGRNLTDGFVPLEVVQRWDPKRRLADRLVEVGLWVRTEVDGEDGYVFHEWDDHQPTRAEVEKRREETRERVRKFREARATERAAAQAIANSGSNSVGNQDGNAVTHANGDASRNADVPDPKGSRPEPDPSRTSYGSTGKGGRSARTTSAGQGVAAPTPINGRRNNAPCRTHPDDDRPCRLCRDIRLADHPRGYDPRPAADIPDDEIDVDAWADPPADLVPPVEVELSDDPSARPQWYREARARQRAERAQQARQRLGRYQRQHRGAS